MCVAFTWSQVSGMGQEPKSIAPEAQAVADRWGGWSATTAPTTIALMNYDERQILIRHYREALSSRTGANAPYNRAKIEGPEYKYALVNLGDPEAVSEFVAIVRNSRVTSPDFEHAFHVLLRSARPEVIHLLAPEIHIDEPFRFISRGDAGPLVPKPYAIAGAMLSIAASASAFNPDLRKWAADNRKVSVEHILPMMREWWGKNAHLIKGGDFYAVRPGADLYAVQAAKDKLIFTQREEYFNDLMAQGKDPSLQENLSDWQERILPSLRSATPVAHALPQVEEGLPRHAKSIESRESAGVPRLPTYIVGILVMVISSTLWLLLRRKYPKT